MLAERLPSLDPVMAAASLCGEPGFVWLDSAAAGHAASQWSYLCAAPVSHFTSEPGPEALAALKRWLGAFSAVRIADGAPFQGGAVGYLAYDFAPAFEPRFRSRHFALAAPALEFALYDTVIALDHARGEATAYSAGFGPAGEGPDTGRAWAKLDRLKALLARPPGPLPTPKPTNWTAATSEAAYCDAVRRAQDYIRAGDIYQANLAGLWTAPAMSREAAFAEYLSIRKRTAVPFAAYGVFSGRIIASASPERLVRAGADGQVLAEPIKGTIRRGEDAARDAGARAALLASEKDRAENVMIVDLLRNDLSRVCEPSSVKVRSLCRLESFGNLHHLVSSIEGHLAPGRDSADLLAAVFPGGSITGAPKLRAMEVIDTLEPAARGVFCGALAWIGYDGAMDGSILIRTLDILPHETRFWAGAGITLLSDPEAEYQEVRLKAERIMAPAGDPVEPA